MCIGEYAECVRVSSELHDITSKKESVIRVPEKVRDA